MASSSEKVRSPVARAWAHSKINFFSPYLFLFCIFQNFKFVDTKFNKIKKCLCRNFVSTKFLLTLEQLPKEGVYVLVHSFAACLLMVASHIILLLTCTNLFYQLLQPYDKNYNKNKLFNIILNLNLFGVVFFCC